MYLYIFCHKKQYLSFKFWLQAQGVQYPCPLLRKGYIIRACQTVNVQCKAKHSQPKDSAYEQTKFKVVVVFNLCQTLSLDGGHGALSTRYTQYILLYGTNNKHVQEKAKPHCTLRFVKMLLYLSWLKETIHDRFEGAWQEILTGLQKCPN